ncbi:MAG: hypothetical protein O7G88_08465, partial [bacterium]|nr:hypothetical protein [bacterium]
MRVGRFIKVIGLVGVTLALGALASWWFLPTVERDARTLQATSEQRRAERRDNERVKAQLRTENQRLRQGNAILQTNLVELSTTVAAMEDTELTLKTA